MPGTDRVPRKGEIILNSVRYRLAEGTKVHSQLVSTYPEKLTIGDYTKDTKRRVSTQQYYDYSQGIGLERATTLEEKRAWWSTADIRKPYRVTLPPLATQTEAFALSRTGTILMGELDGTIVAVVGRYVQSYSGSAWTERQDLGAVTPTDILNITLTSTEFLVVCYTSGYAYEDDITTAWLTSAKATVKLTYWDEKLWGISAAGQLWFSYTMGSGEVNDAQLPLNENDAITSLFTGPDEAGNEIIYCTTKKFLWKHDFGNRKWVRTSVRLPDNLGATGVTRQAALWRGMMCLGANTGFLQYIPDRRENVIIASLLGHDDGLKNTKEGRVFYMAPSVGDLLIATNVVNSTDSAAILMWNDQNGFQVLWEAPAADANINSIWVSDAITNYRCWFGYANRVWWVRLHDSVANPGQVQGWTYSARDISDTNPILHETPWISPSLNNVLLRLRVEVEGASATEAVRVRYGTNYSTSWTQLDQTHSTESTFDATDDRIEGSGLTTFNFTEAAPAGIAFRAIRWEFALRRGTTATVAPVVTNTEMEYLRVLDDSWGFDVVIDVSRAFGGESSQRQRALIRTAVETDTLIQFTYRDDTGGTRNYWVNAFLADSDEESGHDETGLITLRLEQPS